MGRPVLADEDKGPSTVSGLAARTQAYESRIARGPVVPATMANPDDGRHRPVPAPNPGRGEPHFGLFLETNSACGFLTGGQARHPGGIGIAPRSARNREKGSTDAEQHGESARVH